MNTQDTLNLAVQHHQAGRLAEARALYQQVLTASPDHVDALHLLGVLAYQQGDHLSACDLINRAIARGPATADFYYNLGLAETAQTHWPQAAAAYRHAATLRPNHFAAWAGLAEALCEIGQMDHAAAAARQALALNNNHPNTHNNLGRALYARANLDGALAAFRRAVELRPDYFVAINNLGQALLDCGQIDEAISFFRRGIELAPGYPLPHFNMGMALLLQGDYPRGWPEYEWRWRVPELAFRTQYPRAAWDGADLAGRRIMLHAEQGFGDMIQCSRYVPLVAQRGGKIIFVCDPSLHRLFKQAWPFVDCVAPDHRDPEHDVHCRMMTLPHLFNTTLASIPPTPYLAADPALAAQWKARLPADRRLKVGFIWANNPIPPNRCPLAAQWAPLAAIPNVWFCSLQKQKFQPPPRGMQLADWTSELNDFTDTAALLHHLDLLITVDTAVAHLAGAMGKPVWLALKYVPDWRWLLNRADSPWYPTARLFRQGRLGDWQTPITEIAHAGLRALSAP